MSIVLSTALLAALVFQLMAAPIEDANIVAEAPVVAAGKPEVRRLPNEVPPRDDLVVAQVAGLTLDNVSGIDDWYSDFYARKEKSGPNPAAYEVRMKALETAESLGKGVSAVDVLSGTAKMLMIPFEFNGTDNIAACDPVSGEFVYTDTIAGPLNGTIPNPAGTTDNFSIWTDDFSTEWYEKLMFSSTGITEPVRTDLNSGAGIDISGISASNWYSEQSEGQYTIDGDIYPSWIQLDHSVAWYGWDAGELNPAGDAVPCYGTSSGYGFEFAIDIAAQLNDQDPTFDWAEYDVYGPGDQGPPDGIVDHFMVIHAGEDNSGGGGSYGNYQMWAHSWDVYCDKGDGNGLTAGCLVQGGDTITTTDDIYISNYTHIPEDAAIGVVVHEYGHDIGLPDYYDQTGATSNSTAHWMVMSGGSWSGELGGTSPTPFNPWARYFFGWETPLRLDYTTTLTEVVIGQSEPTPVDTYDSVWIDLPDQAVTVDNMAGEGKGLHSILGNDAEYTLMREFDLGTTTAPMFTFDTYFTIEEDWDYTYILASTDDGTTWDILLNEEGVYATTDPNGTIPWIGPGGLTGHYEGVLTYDLTAYAGESSVWFQFLYATDGAVQDPGMWVDNFSLDDGATNLYSSDLEDSSDWDNSDGHGGIGWEEVPYNDLYPHYYMLEWRNDEGSIASEGHTGNYYYTSDGSVDKFPSSVPGMLIWYRNTFYNNNQAVNGGRESASPAMGPKGELLLVDSHYDPITWSGGWWDADAGEPAPAFSNRRAAMDGSFALGTAPAWMIHDYADSSKAIMDFGSRPTVSGFHDSMRSVPGWVFPGDGYVYRADNAASVVIPAADDYTTRVRDLNGTNLGDDVKWLWAYTVGGQALGTGNPGDAGVQYGVHIALSDVAVDGSQATVDIWNSQTFVEVEASVNDTFPGGTANYTAVVSNTSPFTETFNLEFYVEYADGSYEVITATETLASGDSYTESVSDNVALGTVIGTPLYAEAYLSIPSQNYEDSSWAEAWIVSPLDESVFADDSMGNPVSSGDEISYTLTITNSESRVIDGFVYIPIPEGVTYVEGSAYGGLTPVSMSQSAAQEMMNSGGIEALRLSTATGAVSGLISVVSIPADGTLPDMGFTVTVNAGELDGSVDMNVAVYEGGYPSPIFASSTSVEIEPVATIFLPMIVKN